MNNEFEYYLVRPVFDGTIPTVRDKDGCSRYAGIMRLCLASPVPKKPRMVDYHSLDGADAVYSQKVCDVLKPMKIKGVDLKPVIITGKKGEEHCNYYFADIYNEILSFDKERSVYDLFNDEEVDRWLCVDKIVLNTELLSKIPLEDRLIYVSIEHSGQILYHKSVVDTIMPANPVGVTFIPVVTWNPEMMFD